MQLQITSDRIYFSSPRGEQMIIGHPPEFEKMLEDLFEFCRTYRTPEQRALDEVLAASVDVVDPETILTLAPEWMEDEPLNEGMVRKKHGALYREKRKPGKKPANESKGG